MLPVEVTVTVIAPVWLAAKIPFEAPPVVVMLPVEVTVTAPMLSAKIPTAKSPPVVMLPVDVTVTLPEARV